MTIETTRRRVLSGVAGGAIAVAVAPFPVPAEELDDVLTPQEQWDGCIDEAVRLLKKGSALLEQHGRRIHTEFDEFRPELR